MNLNEPTILPLQKNDNKHKYTLNKHKHYHCTTCTRYTTNNHKMKKIKCRDDKKLQIRSNKIIAFRSDLPSKFYFANLQDHACYTILNLSKPLDNALFI
jgi:hypothetical protein